MFMLILSTTGYSSHNGDFENISTEQHRKAQWGLSGDCGWINQNSMMFCPKYTK